jgi:hypothetical protein
MLYKLSTTLPKNQAITVISAGVIGVSYLTFAAFRYSGAFLSRSSRASPAAIGVILTMLWFLVYLL